MISLQKLEKEATEVVASVANNPEGRYELRKKFYEKFGHPIIKGHEGLGNSELAFMEWEIKRGVLNPLDAEQPGSPWWRKVNSYFIYLSTLAELIFDSGQSFEDLPAPVNFWLAFMQDGNGQDWYRAHNSSIIAGYSEANEIAFDENIYEQYFMNIVLYRLLYAQSMVEGVSFGILGKIFANPRGKAVSIITDFDSFYPEHYPMTKQEIKYVTHRACNLQGILEDLFDEILILPKLSELYTEAANWDASPIVTEYVEKNKPVYPINEGQNEAHFTLHLKTKEIKIN